jgi:hypothetical protein
MATPTPGNQVLVVLPESSSRESSTSVRQFLGDTNTGIAHTRVNLASTPYQWTGVTKIPSKEVL